MHVLGIIGTGAITLCDQFAAQLDGRITTVESLPESTTEPESADGVVVAYGLSPDGNWVGSGDDCDLDEFFDGLSAEYDYALLSGFPDARVPTVALAGVDAMNVVVEAETANVTDVVSLAAEVDFHELHVTLGTLVEHVKADPLGVYAGTVATFAGWVRARESEDGDSTLNPELEKYGSAMESKMDVISEGLEARDGVLRILMHHRVGVVEDGADIVFVVVLARHHRETSRTVKDSIDRLKDEVPTFKRETTTDKEFWVHDR